jgi:hypothetical protein
MILKWLYFFVVLAFSSNALCATWNITYPRPISENDQRSNYPVALLKLAFDNTGVRFKLIPSERPLQQNQALELLASSREINVVWSMTDKTREVDLLPIRVPIFKGLIGYRVFLVKEEQLPKFAFITERNSLMTLKPIQGHDWPDTKILQSNGFDVVTSREYSTLFTMLNQSQGDYFPRSVVEVWEEADLYKNINDTVVEPNLGINYPTAMYFFVNKRNTTLARLLENGLEKAISNGDFDKLFYQTHQGFIERAKMDKRRFFELENPLLPTQTPLERSELWFRQTTK